MGIGDKTPLMICGWDSIIKPTRQIHTSNGMVRPRRWGIVQQVMLNYQSVHVQKTYRKLWENSIFNG
jgi:hypothetical protein